MALKSPYFSMGRSDFRIFYLKSCSGHIEGTEPGSEQETCYFHIFQTDDLDGRCWNDITEKRAANKCIPESMCR